MKASYVLILILLPVMAAAQVHIREQVEIRPQLKKTSTSRFHQARPDTSTFLESLSKTGVSSSATTATSSGAVVSLPSGGYVTAQVVGGSSNAINDFVLRSPLNQVLVADATHNYGFIWTSDTYSSAVSFTFGLNWTFRGRQGSEYGVLVFQINDSTYHLGFEDIGVLPMFQDLFVEVVAHGTSSAQTNTLSIQVYSSGDISYGDESFLSFDIFANDGRFVSPPVGVTYTFSVITGSSAGFLYDYDHNRDGVTFTGIPWINPFGPNMSMG